jgi:hypothetical protein
MVRRESVKRVQAAHLGESSLEAVPPRVFKLSFLREDYCTRPNSVWRRVEKKSKGATNYLFSFPFLFS